MADPHSALVVYYSRTGTTEAVAEAVAGRLDDPVVERIRPRRERRYLNWLARSFVPGSTVEIEPVEHDPRSFEAAFIGTPKWTLSCPPVTEYLDRVRLDGTTVGLFLTFGGFDEARYARDLVARLGERGAASVEPLLVKRDRVEAADEDMRTAVDAFVDAVCHRTDAA